jgi:hypothetical protein
LLRVALKVVSLKASSSSSRRRRRMNEEDEEDVLHQLKQQSLCVAARLVVGQHRVVGRRLCPLGRC